MPDPTPKLRRDALSVAGAHLTLALYYWLGRGVTIVHDYGPDPWSWFWQNVPTDLLRERPLESLWHLHAQPPVWNAVGAVVIKLFGGAHMPALQAFNVAAGAATAALCLVLAARLTGSRRWGLVCGMLVALHPALFLFEAYALYTTLVALLVILAAHLLDQARRTEAPGYALGFVAVVVALVLTRSLYHLVVLVGAIPLALALVRRPTRGQLAVLALLVALPVGWYGKNAAQHGFFGASSWYGMGLWRSALFGQNPQHMASLRAEGVLRPVVAIAPFSPPSAYVPLGFDRHSDVPLLARDDLHNVNVPDISREYQRSARALILRTPVRYARNVLTGFGNFCAPSAIFEHLRPNRDRIRLHADLGAWLLLRPVASAIERVLGGYYGTVYFLLIPIAVAAPLTGLARVRTRDDLRALLATHGTTLFLAAAVGYTALIGSSMELGENTRFKFPVEPALLVLLSVLASRLGNRLRERRTRTAGG